MERGLEARRGADPPRAAEASGPADRGTGSREVAAAAAEGRCRSLLTAGNPRGVTAEALRAFGPAIAAYLRSLLRDVDDVGDAYSVFAERLWRAIPSFRGDCTVRAYCFRIAWTSARRVLDDPYRTRRVRLRSDLAARLPAPERTSSARRREGLAVTLAALRAELDPDEQNLLALRVDQRLSWREVAAVLAGDGDHAATEVALRKRFERTKEKVAALARERGLLG